MKKNKGFTLAELLIVVAIIAVLVAIAIPIFSGELHKAKVATDWANIRAYYSEIMADYNSTGKHNDKVPTDWSTNPNYKWQNITFLDGTTIDLNGYCAVSFADGKGYHIEYNCPSYDNEHELILGYTAE